jgi:demethylmenaquinone methyltransferase/2-methoxy-6-polyprenyl-1,4-benzoquinol methylase
MPVGKKVQSMFSGISGKYDFANHFLSGGVDLYWRRRLVNAVRRHNPSNVADLATGSGDVALALRKRLPVECAIAGLDFCEPMLEVARQKQAGRSLPGELTFSFGDCMDLPLESDSVDAVTIAFGLRNFEDRHKGLCEMRRVLRPGEGALFVLEFTQPDAWLKPVYGPYLKYVLPHLARLSTGDKAAYDYLAGSIEAFPDKASLTAEMEAAGFENVQAAGLTGSIVALHIARA